MTRTDLHTVVFDAHSVHTSLSSLFMRPLPVQSYHCHTNAAITSHDNCGPLVVHMDSSMSASHFASRCVRIGGVVCLAT